jgi:beta-glucosidase
MGGVFPPGVNSVRRAFNVLRRMLLAHGRAYRTIHRMQGGARVGLAHNHRVCLPANPTRVADRRMAALLDGLVNHAVYEAMTSGKLLPPLGVGQRVAAMIDACDYIGVNYYSPTRVSFDPTMPGQLFARQSYSPAAELSDATPTGEAYGEIAPDGLYRALLQASAYGKPIYITECGVPDHDDDVRPRFLATHVAETWRAIRDGADVRGFYHWTLADNFEWAAAWSLRFGLFELDPATQARTPRTSAAVYSRIARANGVPVTLLEKIAPGYEVGG